MNDKYNELIKKLYKEMKMLDGQGILRSEGAIKILNELYAISPNDMDVAIIELTHGAKDKYLEVENVLTSFLLEIKKALADGDLSDIGLYKETIDFFSCYSNSDKAKDSKLEAILNNLPLDLIAEAIKAFRPNKDLTPRLTETGEIVALYREANPDRVISTWALRPGYYRKYINLVALSLNIKRATNEERLEVFNSLYEEAKEFYLVPTYIMYVEEQLSALGDKKHADEAINISIENTKRLLENNLILRRVLSTSDIHNNEKGVPFRDFITAEAKKYPVDAQKKFLRVINDNILDRNLDFLVETMRLPIVPLDLNSLHREVEKVSVNYHNNEWAKEDFNKAYQSAQDKLTEIISLKKTRVYGEREAIARISLDMSYEGLMDFEEVDMKKYSDIVKSCNEIRFWYGVLLSFDSKTSRFYDDNVRRLIKEKLEVLSKYKNEDRFRVKEILDIINGKGGVAYKKQMKERYYFQYMDNHPELMSKDRAHKKYHFSFFKYLFYIILIGGLLYLAIGIILATVASFTDISFPDFINKIYPLVKDL